MIGKWRRQLKSLFEHNAVVLMYHRIAAIEIDPWELAVSPANFDAQVQLLTKNFTVVSVPQLLQQVAQKALKAHTVCLTFDDGYSDNYLFAKPILEKYNCPATFFIPSYYIGSGKPFWWDELDALLLSAPHLPQLFQITINDEPVLADLGDEAHVTVQHREAHRQWAWPAAAPTRRCALYLKIWELLKPLPLEEIQAAMEKLKEYIAYEPEFEKTALPMNAMQLQELAQHPLFTLGLHTTTHLALGYHTEQVQYAEIADNKKALQSLSAINSIAFPYGNYNNSTICVLQKQRIDAGFTTAAQPVTNHSNPHCLGRLQVRNSNAHDFETALRLGLKA